MNWFDKISWPLVWLVCVLSLLAAIRDSFPSLSGEKPKVGNLILLWSIFLASALASVCSQVGSDKADKTLEDHGDRLRKLRRERESRVSLIADLLKALEDQPRGVAEIVFHDGDGEAGDFARWLKSTLIYHKWDVRSVPCPIGNTVSGSYSGIPSEEIRKFSPAQRLGASSTGVSLIANRRTIEKMMRRQETTPLRALLLAMNKCDIRCGLGQDDASLQDDLIRVVVAPKG
jgi:hypothetical protein